MTSRSRARPLACTLSEDLQRRSALACLVICIIYPGVQPFRRRAKRNADARARCLRGGPHSTRAPCLQRSGRAAARCLRGLLCRAAGRDLRSTTFAARHRPAPARADDPEPPPRSVRKLSKAVSTRISYEARASQPPRRPESFELEPWRTPDPPRAAPSPATRSATALGLSQSLGVHDHGHADQADRSTGQVVPVGPESIEEHSARQRAGDEDPAVRGQDPPEVRIGLEVATKP